MPQILAQRVDDDPMVNFVYGYGRALATDTSTSATFSHDAFGTPLHTQQTAAWVDPPGSDPFGAPGDDQPWPSVPAFGYRGELTLAPFLHLRARLYDPVPGRFTSRDPAGAPIGSAMPLSPYTYADNDPVNLAGLFSIGGLASVIRAFIARLLEHSACGVRYCIGPPTVPGT